MPPTSVNVCHVVVNPHGGMFDELIESLAHAFSSLGYSVERTTNRPLADRLNILVGHTGFLAPGSYAALQNSGAKYVVYQTEVLDDAVGFAQTSPASPGYLEFLRAAPEVWDYSPTNFTFLQHLGCKNLQHIPVGFAPSLERIVPEIEKDIDVLFYGMLNPRRERILSDLHDRGARVTALVGRYGRERDELIGRAKIVLNVHQFDAPHLEEVRLAYLLNNRTFVISEASDRNPYDGGIVFSPYAQLVERCCEYLRSEMDAARQQIADFGYAAIQAIPMARRIADAMAAHV